MNLLKTAATTVALVSLLSIGRGAELEIDYSGGGYTPYSGTVVDLKLMIDGDTASQIKVTDGATLNNPLGDALTVDYIGGTTLHYLVGTGSTGTINGNIKFTIRDGVFNNQTTSTSITEAFIATSFAASSVVVNGNVESVINGGSFHGNVLAGGGARITGNTSLTITGGTFVKGSVMGGNSWGGVTEGNSVLHITGGDLSKVDVYGGSFTTNSNDFTQSGTEGNISVIIDGGDFRNINGGGRDSFGSFASGKTGGNTSIEINAQDSITIAGDINVTSGDVGGNGAVTFTGDANNLDFGGDIRTRRADDAAFGDYGGEASIHFGTKDRNFTGTFNGAIEDGFDSLVITSSTEDATFVDFALQFNVDTLMLDAEGGVTVALADGTTFSKLSLVLGGSFVEGDPFVLDLNALFVGVGNDLLVNGLLENGASLTVFDSSQQEWSTYYSEGEFTVVEVIPEPSTYALLSALAVGWLIYRRRTTLAHQR